MDFLKLKLGDRVNIDQAKKHKLYTRYSPDGDGETVVCIKIDWHEYDLYLVDFPFPHVWNIIFVFDTELPEPKIPKLEPLYHPNLCLSVLIPEPGTDLEELRIKQDIGIEETQWFHYSVRALLKKYKNNPVAIDFITDLL